MLDLYAEITTFADGDMRGDFVAASRAYREISDIGTRAGWDVVRIAQNKDGDRWRALLTRPPAGVEESRAVILDRCRILVPPPPSIEVVSRGRIRDSALASLLGPSSREIYVPAAPSTAEEEPPSAPSA